MSLGITSIGVVSSVGRNALQACAAIRAGVSLPRRLRNSTVLDDETQQPMAVVGYPVHGYTNGFLLVGRWLRLARGCLHDLLRQGRLPDALDVRFWRRTTLITVIPYLRDERFMTEDDADCTEGFLGSFLEPLHKALGLPMLLEKWEVVDRGHAGAAAAVERGRALIGAGAVDRVIIVAVDSYVDNLTVEWLSRHGRLKSEANPVGATPGEAGACLVVESMSAARAREAPWTVPIVGASTDREPAPTRSGQPSRAVGLSRAILATFSLAGASLPFEGLLVSDHNGEPWRAQDFAHMRSALSREIGARAHILFPAANLGDTGAASGALGLCYAVCSFLRGPAVGAYALVISSSERGDVGAVLLSRSG